MARRPKNEIPEPGLRMAIDAAKLYYVLRRTSAILCGHTPRIGLSLGSALHTGMYGG